MKNCRYLLLFLLSLLFQMKGLSVETKRMTFSKISSEQGLSHNTVISVIQDKNESLWFATFDGLNRYDGYTFTVYRNERKNPHSLQNDVLRVLFIDSQENLWIGTKSGLSCYVSEKDNFDNYLCTHRNGQVSQVNAIVEYDKTHLLLGTEYGLILFNKQTHKFEAFQPISKAPIAVQSLARQNDNILVGTNKGLFVYKISKKHFSTVHSAFAGKVIQAILPQSDTRIWIGTEGAGLFLFNMLTGELKNYIKNPGNPNSLSSNFIRSLAFDSQYRLWVGTFNGLSVMSNGDESFVNYFHNPTQGESISQNSVRSIFMDTQGGMWLGTYYGGINYYHPLKNQFGHIQQNPYTHSLNDKVMSCMVEDESGKMWIGTNDKGVNVFDPHSGSFRYFTSENTGTLKSNNIKSFLPAKDLRSMYVGTHGGGLFVMNKVSGICSRIPAVMNLANEDVYALTYDSNNSVWIGALSGLYNYNEKSKEVKRIDIRKLSSTQVMCLKADSKKRLWIGGEKSLGVYSLVDRKLRNFKSEDYNGTLSNGSINCIFEDSKKRIWIGTRGGLNLYNEDGTFKSFSKENGLSNNMVYGILEDSYGRLWLSTNNGIACFSPDTKLFRNYSEADGLPFKQFNMYSFCQSKSGLMYFGGINGIITFYPELLIDNPYTPKPKISRILIFNKDLNPFDESGVLTNNVLETKQIKLRSDQSNFALELVVSNFLSGKHNVFAYFLEGYDKDWTYTSENRVVSYSNLSHGKYIFKLKAANSDGKWNEEATELTIIILPHWWQTWWAFILFSILTFGAIFLGLRILRQRQAMQNQLRIERLEKEKLEEVDQMKMRFFINISHEFRTPLTLILSPLQEIIERNTDKWQHSQLIHVQKNANKLLHLINQLMDYRRAELGVFELRVKRMKSTTSIFDTFALFEKLSKRKKIDYKFQDQTNDKEFLVDPNYLELIVSNLLSNAFKFTPEGGKISVRLEEDVNSLILEVKDSGCGIPTDKQALIFDRFYQIGNDNLGTGIGLSLVKRLVDLHHAHIEVKSEVGKGSTFTVSFLQNEELYELTDDETCESLPVHTTNYKNLDYLIEDPVAEEEILEENSKLGTILIVEDNFDVMEYLSERLSKSYSILTALNGLLALELLKEQPVDLILTDVMMPEMDGIRLCKAIKQNIRTCHIPVIILSAKSNIEDQLQGLQVGADDYVSKPFTFSVLNAKIINMLKSRRRTLDHYSNSPEIEPEKITFNAMDEELLTKAMKIVFENLDNSEFSADIFCSAMGMSRSNLHLKLKAITGESTIDFIRKIRFNEACKLLLDGRYNIAEVSTRVGFNTPSYFATSFKKHFGSLPTEYVKSRRT